MAWRRLGLPRPGSALTSNAGAGQARGADRHTGLAVVVVNYASSELLRHNLTAVHAELPDALMVVVDNFSSQTEQQRVRELSAERGWESVLLDTNTGFGGGVNAGATRAFELGATQLLLLNPDATIDAASVDRLRAVVDAEPLVVAAPVIRRPDGHIWFQGVEVDLRDGSMHRYQPGRPSEPDRVLWLTGACMLVPREVWDAVGGFDGERYFLYWEDVDFSQRVRDAGGTLRVVPEAEAIHDEGGTQQAGRPEAKSAVYYYYNIRNRLLFASLHLSPQQQREWQRTAWQSAKDVLLRGGRRQFLHPVAPVRAAYRGVRDGRRLLAGSGSPRAGRGIETP